MIAALSTLPIKNETTTATAYTAKENRPAASSLLNTVKVPDMCDIA
jgi:hypothetical protein